MKFYMINTDSDARKDIRTCDLWFQHGMAFAGDKDEPFKHSGLFSKLQPHDTVFMWHSELGCVGVGSVLEAWDGRRYEDGERHLYVREPYEYRIKVQWIQDWRTAPKGEEHGLPVPRGNPWQEIDSGKYPFIIVYSSGKTIPTREEEEDRFQKEVKEAGADNDEIRRKRLESANPIPHTKQVLTTVFDRNPDVVAEVLKRANGICEECKMSAPFLKKSDNSPYLEVHHVKTLASGGTDTVKNAMAICPNCHRKSHYGK